MKSTIKKELVCKDNTWTLAAKEYPNWYGIPDIGYIYYNSWSDPDLEYDGKIINCREIEDTMWEYYNEDCDELNMEPTDDGFKFYLYDNLDEIYEMLNTL